MSCYENKHIGLALKFVIYEFEASKKCQVSLVVQYIYILETKSRRDVVDKPLPLYTGIPSLIPGPPSLLDETLKVSEYNKEMPQSYTKYQPIASRGRVKER